MIGSSGGIGGALLARLAADRRHTAVLGFARQVTGGPAATPTPLFIDLEDEDSIRQAAQTAAAAGPVRLVIVATGILHGPSVSPEKHWRAIEAQSMAKTFAINTIGPALVAKHFLPLFPRQGRSVFAALSARVGSIGDNRLGGWYSYRASKAALNMVLRTLAIELARQSPEAVCIGLHPGTVATALSKPFSTNVPVQKLFSAERAAEHLLDVMDRVQLADSGSVMAWDGSRVPD